jgi:predicted transcriptional regulator
MRQSVLTARIDTDVATKLDLLAARTGRSRSWLTATAVTDYVEREAAFLDFVQEGIDAVARGEFLDEAEADRVIDAMIRDIKGG